jgi:homoserine kinase type II
MAIYTFLNESDVAAHIERYDIGRLLGFNGIASGIENSNYLIDTSEARFILTIFEKRTREQDLPFFIELMRHLKTKNRPVAEILTAKSGNTVLSLKGKPALLSRFLHGKPIEPTTAAACHQGGKMLAQLHLATTDFSGSRQNTMGPDEWKRLLSLCHDPRAKELLQQLGHLKKFWSADIPQGILHGDFFPDNVFFDVKQNLCGVIDFYFACTGAFIYDLMLAFNPWCSDNGKIDADKAQAFLSGYQSARSLTPPEKEVISEMGALAALRIATTRLYDSLHPAADALVTPKDPHPYIDLLQRHLSDDGKAALQQWL